MGETRAAASHGDFLGTHTFGSLDGLRCLSILAVIWHHAAGDLWTWMTLDDRGFLGVDLFFVISGFLIVTLLKRERSATGDISLLPFYGRRSLRIFPLYFAVLAGIAVACQFLDADSATRAEFGRELPYLATYTGNWVALASLMNIAWSLAAEEQFYLVWPPLEKWLRPSILVAVLAGFIAVNQLVNFHVLEFRALAVSLPMIDVTFTPICLGVALAHLLHGPDGFALTRVIAGGRYAALAALTTLVGLCALPVEDVAGWPRLAIQLSMTWLLACCVIRQDHVLSRVLGLAPIRRIGVISYGIYLLHMFALHAATLITPAKSLTRFAIGLIVAVGFAEVSYRLFETPFLRLKQRFRGV